MPVDPVCGMEVGKNTEMTLEHEGEPYYFCSHECRNVFQKNPEPHMKSSVPNIKEVYHHYIPRIPYGRARGEFDMWIKDEKNLQVGDKTAFTRSFREEDLRKFAEASGDTNALHMNEAFARKTRFKGRIVHGTLVASLISAALACFPGLTIYINQNLEFSRPARIGKSLTASCEIVEKLEKDQFRLTTRVENAANDILIHGTATVLIDPMPTFEQADHAETP